MATPASSPSTSATKRENDLLAEQIRLQTALSDLQENIGKVLMKNSKSAALLAQTQRTHYKMLSGYGEEIAKQDTHINNLQKSILDKTKELETHTQNISNLTKSAILPAVKLTVTTEDQINAMLELEKIHSKVANWQKTKQFLSNANVDILKKAAAVQGITLATMQKGSEETSRTTNQMIQQARLLVAERESRKAILNIEALEGKLKQNSARFAIKNYIMANGYIQKYMNMLGGVKTIMEALNIPTTSFVKLLSGRAAVAGAVLLSLVGQIWKVYKELDKAAFDARQEMGMMRSTHAVLRTQAEELYKQWAHLGVTAEMFYKAQVAIGHELGSTIYASKELVTYTGLMAAHFKISEETSVRLLKVLGQMGNTTAETQISMAGYAAALANAEGVPLSSVMNDIANASETTRTMMSGTVLEFIKTAVEARRLGTTMDKLADSGRGLLDFASSMEAEMEASVLLGKSIDFQKARQYAWDGKLLELAEEQRKLAKEHGFLNMNVIAKEKFAKAAQIDVITLSNMLQLELQRVEALDEANRMAEQGDKSLLNILNKTKELRGYDKQRAEDLGTQYILNSKNESNQERMKSISDSWRKIMIQLSYAFLPMIDGALKLTAALLPAVTTATWLGAKFYIVAKWVKAIVRVMSGIPPIIKTMSGGFLWIKALLPFFSKFFIVTMAIEAAVRVGMRLYGVFKKLKEGDWSGAFVDFMKIGPGVLWDMFVRPIFKLIGMVGGLFSDSFEGIMDSVILGLENSGTAIYEAIVSPFKAVWAYIAPFLGQSPSKLGLSIAAGIKAVGGMLLSNLTSPFKLAWKFIKGIFEEGFGATLIKGIKAAGGVLYDNFIAPLKGVWGWISGKVSSTTVPQQNVGRTVMDSKTSTLAIPINQAVAGDDIKSYNELNKIPKATVGVSYNTATSDKESITTLVNMQSSVLQELKGLRSDMASGKIAVFMDSQLVSITANRTKAFRGNYGAKPD